MLWFQMHWRRLERLLRRRGSSAQDAEDLIQEAYLRVQAYCDRGGDVQQPEAFLVRTVLNLARDKRAREHRDLYVEDAVETLSIADLTFAPEQVLAAEDRLKELENALDAIGPRTKDIFMMHRVNGLTYAQIADHFDISVSAVEKHIAKAMAALARQLVRS